MYFGPTLFLFYIVASARLQLLSCGDFETNPCPSLSGCNDRDAGMATQQQTSSTSIVNPLKCGLINNAFSAK